MSKLKSFVKRHRKAFTIGGFGLMGIIGFFFGRKYEKRRIESSTSLNSFDSVAENVIDARRRFTR
jgi:hypothetical protein